MWAAHTTAKASSDEGGLAKKDVTPEEIGAGVEEGAFNHNLASVTRAHLDVLDGVLKLWPYNIVQGIDTSIGCLDGLIKGQECSLQGCQLHK